MDRKELKRLRLEARETYSRFSNPAWCAALQQHVYFNAEGFHHLIYNGLGRERSILEQKHKLNLVSLIPIVLVSAADVAYRKTKKRGSSNIKPVEYWGLTAKVGERTTKVILKRTGSGNIVLEYYGAQLKRTMRNMVLFNVPALQF